MVYRKHMSSSGAASKLNHLELSSQQVVQVFTSPLSSSLNKGFQARTWLDNRISHAAQACFVQNQMTSYLPNMSA